MTATALIVLTFGGAAWAAPGDDFTRLLALNPGLTATELEASAREAAAASGQTYEEMIRTALEEAERHRGPIIEGSSDCTLIEIGAARYKGDIFYSAASTYGVPHGHVGIYSGNDLITEALGGGKLSGNYPTAGRRYCTKIEKMEVAIGQSRRDQAADYARQYLIDKPYNDNFAFSKGTGIDTLNCSELVWKAYTRSVRIDLNTDGGTGVHPRDIRDHYLTKTFQVVG